MSIAVAGFHQVSGSIFRPEFVFCDPSNPHSYSYMEKRQLFLRSYQFSRKQSLPQRLRLSLLRVKRIFWVRLHRAARKLRPSVWLKLRHRYPNYAGRSCSRPFRRLVPIHRSASAKIVGISRSESAGSACCC